MLGEGIGYRALKFLTAGARFIPLIANWKWKSKESTIAWWTPDLLSPKSQYFIWEQL